MKKILMVGTGGTIASEMTAEGLAPELNTEQLLEFIPDIGKFCRVDCLQLYNLDSTNIRPADWLGVADILHKRRKPVRKAQYIVAIKRYSTVFIGVFPVKMLRYTVPYRFGYYQITITFRAIFTHCDTCFGSSLHPLPCRFASRADNHR